MRPLLIALRDGKGVRVRALGVDGSTRWERRLEGGVVFQEGLLVVLSTPRGSSGGPAVGQER